MISRHFSSQQGFSLIRFVILLLTLLGFTVLVLALLPRLSGGNIDILNTLSQRAQNLMSGVTQKISAIGQSIASPIDKLKWRIVRLLEDLSNWLYCNVTHKDKCPKPPVSHSLTTNCLDNLSKLMVPSYTFTKQSLEKLRNQGIPENILNSLQPIIDPKLTTRDDILNAIEKQIGKEQFDQYSVDVFLRTETYANMYSEKLIRSAIMESLRHLENQKFPTKEDLQNAIEKQISSSGLTATPIEMDKIDLCVRVIPPGTSDPWVQDMQDLITYASDNGYDMQAVKRLLDKYRAGETGQKQVEAEYFDQLQQQTAEVINKSIERFRKRPLGCSDFTVELVKIWEIEQYYNVGMPTEYVTAKNLSQELHDPRSLEFARETFGWLGYQDSQWFMEQLAQAIPIPEQTTDYPKIIENIDARIQSATNPFDCVLGNITVAEIYLNYDLIDPAQNRFDQAIRDLAGVFTRYGSSIPPDKLAGLHMALGFLNERVCYNNDLAIKEFKDAVAAARRSNLKCEYYNLAHYQLGVINLKLRDAKVQPIYETVASPEATPVPEPSPTATPTPRPNPIKIEIEIPIEIFQARSLKAAQTDTNTSRALTQSGVTKGEITTPRDIRDIQSRLKPRSELGKTQQMKTFSIDQLYDLSRIPDSAIREFESYLQCSGDPSRVRVARYIHDRYMGK